MALIVRDPRGPGLDSTQRYHLYCLNDAGGTRKIFDKLHPMLGDQEVFYDAMMAFMSPALAMSLRGIAVDAKAVVEALKLREGEEREAIERLRVNPMVKEVWDVREQWDNARDGYCLLNPKKLGEKSNHKWTPRGTDWTEQSCERCSVSRSVVTPLNPHSSPQMARLLYDILGVKPRYDRKTGEVTTNDDALEAIALRDPELAPLVDDILSARGARKQVSLLHSKRDPDGRWRHSGNISAAETDRMSSSKSANRTGGNTQNIADRSRNIFVADPGLEFFYIDGEQAESRIVAADAECPEDLADHASGDTHTMLVKRMSEVLKGSDWEKLPWGTASDKEIAKTPTPWDPEHDFRHFAKIVRHGTNIGMTHVGISREARVPQKDAKLLREAYFKAYPRNLARQMEIRREIRETGALTNPLGRTRLFLGRLWDESTMKEGLAQTQQGTIAWLLNIAMWRVFDELDSQLNMGAVPNPSQPNKVWLLAQVHDALLGLYRPGDNETLARMKAILETPIMVRGKPVIIPAEVLIGPTWRKDALRVWKP